MIISGGVNIYPREIEDVLLVHPAVADVGVLGTPDPDMGEQVTAFVQLADGGVATEDELIDWCRERLSHLKCPREVRFVDNRRGFRPAGSSSASCSQQRLGSENARIPTFFDHKRGGHPAVSPSWRRRSASNSAMPAPTAASLSSVNFG